ncbi:MAG: NtaA/DmoA family FMN-dependent monooxygenase, partial [Solirubrobacteraceae bacterium]|nr:NtaA/DmoA family FMN-dependent monooxygenase [Solirubrobacteraceae bacterium]
EDGARLADKATGVFADGDQIHRIDHEGQHYRVAGPLDVPRSPQGWPVLVQAGQSESGRQFAARWAEAVFTTQRALEDAQAFSADLKGRAHEFGRSPDSVKVLPGVVPFLGSTEREAREREAEFEEVIVPAYGLKQLSNFFGVDLTGIALDEPLPEVPEEDEIEGFKSRSTLVRDLARGEDLTVRQLIGKLGGGRGHRTFTGTPEQLADNLELWFREGGADGFNVMAPAIPGDLQVFIDQVLPILRKRGLFRDPGGYEGSTLREHLGLLRPESQYARAAVGATR